MMDSLSVRFEETAFVKDVDLVDPGHQLDIGEAKRAHDFRNDQALSDWIQRQGEIWLLRCISFCRVGSTLSDRMSLT